MPPEKDPEFKALLWLIVLVIFAGAVAFHLFVVTPFLK